MALQCVPATLLLDEATACDPESLYAVTKFASEKVAARLAALWQSDIISVRLSGVFGPWERATDMRDTISPQAQIVAAMHDRRAAILPRPGVKDWIYAPDVAEAVARLIEAERPQHSLYNISSGANGRPCNGGRSSSRSTKASPAVWPDQAKRRPWIFTVRPIGHRCRWRASSKSSAGALGSAAPNSAADLNNWWRRASRGNLTVRLKGRTAIITGAGSGIGRASALLFATEGAFVALVDRDAAGLRRDHRRCSCAGRATVRSMSATSATPDLRRLWSTRSGRSMAGSTC